MTTFEQSTNLSRRRFQYGECILSFGCLRTGWNGFLSRVSRGESQLILIANCQMMGSKLFFYQVSSLSASLGSSSDFENGRGTLSLEINEAWMDTQIFLNVSQARDNPSHG